MILDSNTLFNIAKHTNKTLKLADYVIKAKRDLFYNSLAKIETTTNEVELIEAFHSDLQDTTSKIKDIHTLLSTVDENGNVLHLVGEKNLETIFGEAYDKKEQTLELPFATIHLHRELDRESLKFAIAKKFFGFNNQEYTKFHSQRKNTFNLSEQELYEDDEKIEFLTSLRLREKYQPAVDKIKELISSNIDFRKRLTLEDKNLIDKEITFDKSMVDSVAQASLYISKKDGVLQWGSGFKTKYPKEIESIVKALKENPYVDAVEIDKDTSPLAFLSFLNQIKDTKFNIKKPVILKSRKLGVYRASGLFYPSQNIVAVDVKNPSAGLHEFIHATEDTNDEILNSKSRYDMGRLLRNRIDKTELAIAVPKSKIGYYLSTTEIMARAGEIAYLFEKYDYKPENESYSEFKERVEAGQKITTVYDLNLVKNISKYETNTNIYFNFTEMSPDVVHSLRDYYKAYYRVDNTDKLENMLGEVKVPERTPHQVVKEVKRYQKTSLSGIQSDTLERLLNYNDKNKTIDPGIFINKFILENTSIGRTTKVLTEDLFADQNKSFEVLCNWAFDNKKFYEMSRIIEGFYRINSKVNTESLSVMDYLKTEPSFELNLDYRDSLSHFKEETQKIHERRNVIYDQIMKSEISNADYHNGMDELKIEYKSLYTSTILKPKAEYDDLKNKTDMYQNLVSVSRNSNYNEFRLNSLRQGMILKMMHQTLERDGNEIANYFTKDDIAPKTAILTNNEDLQSYIRRVERFDRASENDYNIDKIKDVMIQNIKATGQVPEIIDIASRVNLSMTRGDYSVYNASTFDDNFMTYQINNIENNPRISSGNFEFNLFETFFKGEKNPEIINANIPDLKNFDLKTKEVLEFKDSFEYKTRPVDETVLPEREESTLEIDEATITVINEANKKAKKEELDTTSDELVSDIVEQIDQKEAMKNIQKLNKDIISDEIKEANIDESSPIDPNPEVKVASKRGRKKKTDPNQHRLF